MTSVSAPPGPLPVAPGYAQAAPPKRGGVDYSKFDSIVDSDDEKPATKEASEKAPAAPEKQHCHNCMKDIDRPLRCGICKKVSYCSQKCQKDDWSFHKRNCKKPEEPKPKPSQEEKQAKTQAKEENKKKDVDEKIVDDGESLNWYRHREWKPTSEPKQEFRPEQINSTEADAAASSTTVSADGSVWNKAGTWEDKDVTSMAQSMLLERLQEPVLPDIDVAGGAISVEEVEKVEGDASKPVIRGKRRHIFDLSFKVKFAFKWMDSNGQKKATGSLSINDFTNDAFSEDGINGPVVELSFKDRSLDDARRKAVEDIIGHRSWPAPAGTLIASLAARMKTWATEYQEL